MVAAFNGCGQLLLLKRDQGRHCGGLWSFPGGKIEAGESAGAAAVRELYEETALVATDWRLLGSHTFTYPDRHLVFTLFSCRCTDPDAAICESEHRWVESAALADFPMPEANSVLVAMLAVAG
ncbi:NUDIX domain-containing protein [Mariprofundus erugo]|uniref:8-oxo-dGTP diphosphatase n=1 Tax=Mariprofundus erugo TaxID=2528639 RepID=A0A5R9GVH2_9PROT|nr:NUDIX domain-containing protein [Mariprofundus erugo]TLS68147.1 NUDIX domain-containing protein [Mariprofundus erugo]